MPEGGPGGAQVQPGHWVRMGTSIPVLPPQTEGQAWQVRIGLRPGLKELKAGLQLLEGCQDKVRMTRDRATVCFVLGV